MIHEPSSKSYIVYFRQIACQRYLENTTDKTLSTSDTHTVFQIPNNEIASDEVEGASISFKR